MHKALKMVGFVLGCLWATTGCAAPDEGEEPVEQNQEAIVGLCAASAECQARVRELISFVTSAATIASSDDKQKAFFESRFCPKAPVMSHFVDMAKVDADGTPVFTSVQDFTITTDASPLAVANAFRRDWLEWWKGGTVREGTTRMEGSTYHTEIRPLGLSAVSIAMAVPPPVKSPKHPKLESPELDAHEGESLAWDYGLAIKMGANPDKKGQAFRGTMHILVRKTDEGKIHVREMWYRTEPLSPLVMNLLPLGSTENRLRIAAFLHLAATQGCAVPRGTGYPGLIDAFESKRLR